MEERTKQALILLSVFPDPGTRGFSLTKLEQTWPDTQKPLEQSGYGEGSDKSGPMTGHWAQASGKQ
jgi:hypothetical protein